MTGNLLMKLIAIPVAVFSLFSLFIPLKWRRGVAYSLRVTIYWVETHFSPLFKFYRKTTEVQEQALSSTHESPEDVEAEEIPKGDEVVVLFSGGCDSTLSAIRLADHFDRVRLCTFRSGFMYGEDAVLKRVEEIKEWVGGDRVTHEFLCVDEVFTKVFYGHFWRDLRKWGLFKANICGACKIAGTFHIINFCRERDIHFLATGANREAGVGEFFIGQMPATIPLFKDLCTRHGITLLSPVFHVDRSDKVLHEMGFLEDWRGEKFGSGIDGADLSNAMKNRAQIACDQDIFTTIYVQGCCIPMKGHERFQELSVELTRALIEEYEPKLIGD